MPNSRAVVIGGGVVGACCAYYLQRSGHEVTIIDSGRFGAGCSHANCGYVCPSHVLPLAVPGAIRSTLATLFHRNSPLRVDPLVVLRNPGWFLDFARNCNHSRMMSTGCAIQALLVSSRSLFDDLIESNSLDCEWTRRGLLFVFQSARAFEHYRHTDELLEKSFNLPARRLDGAALQALEPALLPDLAGGYLYESDAHLRPDRLMKELRRILSANGVAIRENCPAVGITRTGRNAQAIETKSGELIPAEHFVVATGAWTPQLSSALGCRVPIQPGKGYSLTMPRPSSCPTYPMIFEEHRVAVTPFESGYRLGSTMEFAGYDSSMNPARLDLLLNAAKVYLRTPAAEPVEEKWWGWRPMTSDGLPIIDRSPAMGNVWIAAGHNMLGLSMATGTGKLVSELIRGVEPHIDPAPYRVSRFG